MITPLLQRTTQPVTSTLRPQQAYTSPHAPFLQQHWQLSPPATKISTVPPCRPAPAFVFYNLSPSFRLVPLFLSAETPWSACAFTTRISLQDYLVRPQHQILSPIPLLDYDSAKLTHTSTRTLVLTIPHQVHLYFKPEIVVASLCLLLNTPSSSSTQQRDRQYDRQ